ncbi:MAG TPA: GNAT family N-acetyltransferase [Thermoanaerobaculia bacterium]|nr:GNAT family N-acetyltransferase [Thermoanaerobaculia bacterium]
MTVRIRTADASDAPGIRRVFERAFERPLSQEEWSWKFESNPDGWFGVVAEDGGEIVGNYSGWGTRFRTGGRETVLYVVGDVATDPRVRGLGRRVFQRMTDFFYAEVGARGAPFCFGFPGSRHLAISHRLVGSRTLFPIREVRVPTAAFGAEPSGSSAGDFVGEEFDALHSAAGPLVVEGPVRDRARVNWRFHARPARYYRMVWTRGAGGWAGWAALSVSGARALVVDFLLAPEEAASARPPVFSAAAAEASRLGASELVFWETPGGPARDSIAALPGRREEAGFSLIVRPFEEAAVSRFAASVQLVPSLYDLA